MPTLRLAIDARGSAAGAAQHTAATRRIQTSSAAAARGVGRLDARMTALSKTGALLSRTFVGLFGALAGIAAFRAATKTIAGFEQTMATVLGVTRASAEEFENLTEVARRLGATTRFTAREAGEGLLFLARAGFTTEEAIAAVPATLNLAQAGMLDLGEAADFASNILRQFSLDAEETVRVVDTLVITSNRSNTNVRQLAEAMKFAGPIAGALGITVEETAAAVGALGDAGIQASLAGTSLRGIMLALLGPTGKAKKALEDLGITLDEVNPNIVGITGAFKRLAEANFVAEDALAIFNRRQAGAALILVRSTDAIDALTEANKEFGGEAARVARIMDDTLIGAFFNLRSAIEEVFLRAGEAGLTRVLRNLVDTITGVIRVFNGMADSLGENRAKFERLAERVRRVAVFFGALVAIRILPFFFGLARAIVGTTAAMFGFNVAVAANPLGLLATVIAVAVTALFAYRDTLITIMGTTATVGDFVVATWETIKETVSVVAKEVGELMTTVLDFIAAKFKEVTTFIKDNWKKTFDSVLDVVKSVVNTAVALLVSLGSTIGEIQGRVLAVALALTRIDFSRPIESAKEVFATIGQQLDPRALAEGITATFRRNLDRDFVGEAFNAGKKAADEIKRGVESGLDEFRKGFEGFLDEVADRAGKSARERAAAAATALAADIRAAFELAGAGAEETFRMIDRARAAAFDEAALAALDLEAEVDVDARVQPTLAGAEEISERFTGLATQFLSQQEPLISVAENTEKLVTLAEEEARARKIIESKPQKPNINI